MKKPMFGDPDQDVNDELSYYRFGDIRFGESPQAQGRFAKPVSVGPTGLIRFEDSDNHICPQAVPPWSPDQSPNDLPGQTEDCLFLDVYVDGKTLKLREESPQPAPISPVIV